MLIQNKNKRTAYLIEWVFEAQANKWSQRISALQMDTHMKIEGKNDLGNQNKNTKPNQKKKKMFALY